MAATNEALEKIKSSIKATSEKSKQTIREIIDSNTKYVSTALDSNKKIIDSVRGTLNQEKLEDTFTDANTIMENFEAARQLNNKNTKEMVDFYYKQANLAFNFNQKQGGNLYAQIDAIAKIQREGFNKFTEWASGWWKNTMKETAKKTTV